MEEEELDLTDEVTGPLATIDEDEELDDAAQGQNLNADGTEPTSEVDAAGKAAGLVSRDGKPFRGIEDVERRDLHRWELDPESAEDFDER